VAAGHVSRSERPAGRGEGKTTATALTSHPADPKSKIPSPPNGIPLPDTYFNPERPLSSPPQSKIQIPKSKIVPSPRPLSLKPALPSADRHPDERTSPPGHPEERSDEGSAPVSPQSKIQIPKSKIDLSGSIRVASGPWSLEESWWSTEPADRDYWDIELSDGALYRIYRDRKTNSWFADGIYD
jgi:hypothetical protein